jgi:hypothetical protein
VEVNMNEIQQAEKMANEFKAKALELSGKTIRIVRAVVYEGDASKVFECLAKSLPIGVRDCGGRYTIMIVQGETEVLEPVITVHPGRRVATGGGGSAER